MWHVVYSSEAVFAAAASDVMLLTFVDLKAYNNMHWVLYPWGFMAAVWIGVWSLRAACYAQSTEPATGDMDPLGGLWDWFCEAMLATAFGSLIVVIGMAWRYVPGDPLSADLVPVNLVILAAGMIPIALMIMRRGIAWAWRHRR